jgi:hypothetical protein
VDFDGSGEIELDEFEVIMGSKKQFSKLKGIDEVGLCAVDAVDKLNPVDP